MFTPGRNLSFVMFVVKDFLSEYICEDTWIFTTQSSAAAAVVNVLTETQLKRHARLHTEERPYGCDVCKSRFIQRNHLENHMRFHSGEKLFACRVCGRSFSLRGDLKRHMRVHTGEKPFVCSVCGQRFSRPAYLKKHMDVHTLAFKSFSDYS